MRTTRQTKAKAAVEMCACCETKKAPVIFHVGREQMILTCDRCLEPVCSACSDVDDEGTVTCSNCLQDAAIRAAVTP